MRLDQYILRNFFTALGFFIFALTGMFWLGQSMPLIDEIVLRGEGLFTFLRLSVRLIPTILLNITPVAALGATLYFLNSMASQGEIVVMSAAGRSPLALLRPIFFAGALLASFLLFDALYMAPASNHNLRTTLKDIEANFATNVILGGRFVYPVDGVTIFADESLPSGEMVNVFIEDRREPPIVRSYFAERGFLRRQDNNIQLALINGKFHEHDFQAGSVSQAQFQRSEINMPTDVKDGRSLSYWINETPTNTLIDDSRASLQENSKEFGELIHRLFYPLLALILPLLATLIFIMSGYSRHGYGRPLALVAAIGLGVTALQMGVPALVTQTPSLAILTLLPAIILLIAYLMARRRLS